ncbi:MAG: hypothetical protein JW818_04590, partial [Pirellulales bacterium]|nr:hypothetical protein [Pirellulales bacterium]
RWTPSSTNHTIKQGIWPRYAGKHFTDAGHSFEMPSREVNRMDRIHGNMRFVSTMVEGIEDGFVGQELRCVNEDDSSLVAKLIFWESDGQFAVETLGELPLVVLEEFITETIEMVKLR